MPNEKKLKFKYWWWYIFTPKDVFRDKTIIEISASNSLNKNVTKKLIEKFIEKYYA